MSRKHLKNAFQAFKSIDLAITQYKSITQFQVNHTCPLAWLA